MNNFLYKIQLWLLKNPLKIIFSCATISAASIGISLGLIQFCKKQYDLMDQEVSQNIIEANKALEEALVIKKRNVVLQNKINETMSDVDKFNDFIFKQFSDGRNNDELTCPTCNRKI